MIGNIKVALQGIWSHKLRSVLTMLGVIIGIASIIAIVSTINGTNEKIKNNLIGAGNNAVLINLYEGEYEIDMEYGNVPESVVPLEESVKDDILQLDNAEKVSFFRKRSTYGSVYYVNQSLDSAQILGIDSDYMDVFGYRVKSGRGLTQADYSEYKKVAVIDSVTCEELFQGEPAVGKIIEINSEAFTVVGVVSVPSEFEPVIQTIDDYYMYNGNNEGKILIPDSSWPILYKYDEPQQIAVKSSSTDAMTVLGRETEDLVNAYLGLSGDVKYKSNDILEQAKQLQALSRSTNQQLIWIASISLLVGGIGVMNIMLVSVTERTGEIGLKKALGARKRKILGQFLTESAVLTSIGGILGVIVGIILAFAVSKISEVPIVISEWSIVVSVAFSIVIGIIFGLLPAVKASKLNPIEALQYE